MLNQDGRGTLYTLTDKGLNILRDEYQRLKQLVSDGSDFLEGMDAGKDRTIYSKA